ncbi:hypothetical protein MKX01_039646, partial [Papaver californicum]
PPGDSPPRRSAFDAVLLAGCIPVFFHPGSAYTSFFVTKDSNCWASKSFGLKSDVDL